MERITWWKCIILLWCLLDDAGEKASKEAKETATKAAIAAEIQNYINQCEEICDRGSFIFYFKFIVEFDAPTAESETTTNSKIFLIKNNSKFKFNFNSNSTRNFSTCIKQKKFSNQNVKK